MPVLSREQLVTGREYRFAPCEACALIDAGLSPAPDGRNYFDLDAYRHFHEGMVVRRSVGWWVDYVDRLSASDDHDVRAITDLLIAAGVTQEELTRDQRIEVLANRARVIAYVEQVVRRKWAKRLMGDDITQADIKARILARLDRSFAALEKGLS